MEGIKSSNGVPRQPIIPYRNSWIFSNTPHDLPPIYILVYQDTKQKVTFRTDSLSMITKLSGLLEYEEWYASIYQQHHIDVLLQVKLATLDLKPLEFVLEHVRGHVDQEKKWGI